MPSKINEKGTHAETDHCVVSEHRDKEKSSRNKQQTSYTKEDEMTTDFSMAKLDIKDSAAISLKS